MKHILNDLSSDEKNRILEQYNGEKVVNVKNFKRLLESTLGNIKPLISEKVSAPEPAIKNSATFKVLFSDEGESTLTENTKKLIKDFLRPYLKSSLPTIQKFYKNQTFKLPKFITIGAHTTSGGNYNVNSNVAAKRINQVLKVVRELLVEMGLNDEMIRKITTTNTNYDYEPTSVDANIFDRTRVKPKDSERYAYVIVNSLYTPGLEKTEIGDIEDALIIAKGFNVNPNERGIARAICDLETYSDITDLNYELRSYGGLQSFINSTITDGLTSFGSDTEERKQIKACLNNAAKTSGKGAIAAIAGDKITIIL